MSGHTPGPWFVDGNGFISTHDAEPVQQYTGWAHWPNPKDKLLVEAAPELLEALQWMVEHDETCEGDEPLHDHNGATWNEINWFWIAGLNKARAAIAKATGANQ